MAPRRVALMIVVALASVCVATACGASRQSPAALSITYTAPVGFGRETYRLGCAPVSGTAPRRQEICAAIASQPSLVLAGPGQDHSCPPTPSVAIRGTYGGKPVDVVFSACLAGQGDLINRWLSLLPTTQSQNQVLPDRGLGPVRLGESRAAVEVLLGPATRVVNGIHIYQPGQASGFLKAIPVILGVGYDHGNRVETVLSNSTDLTLAGQRIGSTVPSSSGLPINRPKNWVNLRCGNTAAIADHPLVASTSATIIEASVDHPTAVVSRAAKRFCTAQAAAS